MLFLTAQPDNYYFLWQLELQIFNLKNLGIPARDIHILLGYDPDTGLQQYFKEFIGINMDAMFFPYPDFRESKKYPSSVRPHIIKQHIRSYPELAKTPIFYIDSDVLLRELPDFEKLEKDDCWYVSDTRNYLDGNYILRVGSNELFSGMCKLIGISPILVIENSENTGGAQYILKDISYEFFDKVERDSESLFSLMNMYNNSSAEQEYIQSGKLRREYQGIQAWCSDMWALLWNAWLYGKKVYIHEELDFCWPNEPIKSWYEKKILHYSGVIKEKKENFFCKGNYVHSSPFYDSIDYIDKSSCSYPVVSIIKNYRKELNSKRICLLDVSILISVRIDSKERLENLLIVTRYLDKYFDVQIIIGESDIESRIPPGELPGSCKHIFYEDSNPLFHHTRINNKLIKESTTPIIAIYDTDAIFTVKQIMEAILLMRSGVAEIVSPYDGSVICFDNLFKAIFSKILDPELVLLNMGKFKTATKRSWGGAVFLTRESFIKSGMDNEYFESWGPEDIERIKRMKNLGYNVTRIPGQFFHLPHPRNKNSGYMHAGFYVKYISEYLKICNMKGEVLQAYVNKITLPNS